MARPSPNHAGDPALVRIGQTIRALRGQSDLSQEALAHEAGLDRSYMGGIKRGEQARCGKDLPARVDKIGDFRAIPAENDSLDYLVSSHVIEHEPNPIAAFVESWRVLKKPGGFFFCIFPKRTAEKQVDIFRALTPLTTLIDAWHADRRVTDPAAQPWRGHMYVYSLQSMLRLINWLNGQKLASFCVEAVEETDRKVGNGHTLVLQKLLPHDMIVGGDYALLLQALLADQDYAAALRVAKIGLSFNFFDADLLYAAAILSAQMDAPEALIPILLQESREFYRQCLIENPENATRRREFFDLFGEYYFNPLP